MHYNKESSYLFVNGTEIRKLKSKDSEILTNLLCLGNISNDWAVDNMKKSGIKSYAYDFSVDYDAITVDDTLDTHKYLTKKKIYDIKMFGFIKKAFFTGLTILSTLLSINPLKCVSMNNEQFACGKLKFNLFLNGLWYEPENL